MSGAESDTMQMVDVRRNRGRRGRRNRNRRHGRRGASDSEMRDEEEEYYEDDTYFSDGDSLPSMRAQLAASLRYRKSARDEEKESTPLLDRQHSNGACVSAQQKSAESPSSGYESLPSLSSNLERWARLKLWYNRSKIVVLTVFLITCVALFAVNEENEKDTFFVTIQNSDPDLRHYSEKETKHWEFVSLEMFGPFRDQPFHKEINYTSASNWTATSCSNFVFVCGPPPNNQSVPPCPDTEHVNCQSVELVKNFSGSHAKLISISRTLRLEHKDNFSVTFRTQNQERVGFQAYVKGEIFAEVGQVIISFVILVLVYILIGFDIVHRTLAAMIGSSCALAVLSMLDKRPSLEEVVEWIDLDTICLLFGMMTLVAIFSQTGFFDYSAVKAYKLARGKVWSLITLLCLFSAVVSAFLDNVTTILLLTPVSIRLCQVLNLDPRPILIAEVVFSNIGGTATAIGDPPNVIIISNSLIKQAGIDFPEFTLHLLLGIIFAMVVAYVLLRLIYCFKYIRVKNKDPPHIAELKREIAIWERTARQMPVVSLEERAVRDALSAKANEVRHQLHQEINTSMQTAMDLWQRNLTELEKRYRITNWVLLIKSSVVLAVVILLFFISNIIPVVELDLGWIAIFGAVVLLILADVQELESVLHKIEWATLLFFAALFILMEGLAHLGLISFIGDTMVSIVKEVPKEHQMLVAIVLVVWISAISSAFIDNIPFTTAMIPVIVDLAQSPAVCLSLRPLVWALAFGACLGGNGTLIGASANVVCAGIAEQNGYHISFKNFFKIGFPMMLVTTFTAMVYLLICHVAFDWNISSETERCIAAG